MSSNTTRRDFLKSSSGVLLLGSAFSREEVVEYPNPPEVDNLNDGWTETGNGEIRIDRKVGDDLLCSLTHYEHTDLKNNLSNVIDAELGEADDIDVNMPLAAMSAFKVGRVRTKTETPFSTFDQGNDFRITAGSWATFWSPMADLYQEYLARLFAENITEEGNFHTGIVDLPGSDTVPLVERFRQNAEGEVNQVHHDDSVNAFEYNLKFELSGDIKKTGLIDEFRDTGQIDAKGWLAYWGYDDYLYGGAAVHPRMRPWRGSLDNRTYLESELDEQLDIQASLNIGESLDRKILDMFGDIRDAGG